MLPGHTVDGLIETPQAAVNTGKKNSPGTHAYKNTGVPSDIGKSTGSGLIDGPGVKGTWGKKGK